MFNDINVAQYGLEGLTTEGTGLVMQPGWNKIALVDVGEVTMEKKGGGQGALFTFETIDGNGAQFRTWYCVQALQSSSLWRQQRFESTFVRIAQCLNIPVLSSVDQILNQPFYALIEVNEREYESNDTDEDGNFIMKKTTDVYFAPGLLTEVILSCEDYSNKNRGIQIDDEDLPF